ncbi:sialidase family protein [Pedobacter sp. ASV1-7]|uniref:sialidase family protein n=1 Tax=Pedobacter sp. ASV1-7 TaxID=3145237 RepID=UPI0032E8E094
MMKGLLTALFMMLYLGVYAQKHQILQDRLQVPVLKGKPVNPMLRLKVIPASADEQVFLKNITLSSIGTSRIADIKRIYVYHAVKDSTFGHFGNLNNAVLLAELYNPSGSNHVVEINQSLGTGTKYLWVAVELSENADLSDRIALNVNAVQFDKGQVNIPLKKMAANRIGIALRSHRQDGVNTHRIPGLATAKDGSLIAVYDARRDTGRDLQGNIDIGVSRSLDKGKTWLPMEIAMDMGTWGGLPEKFNGVSDAGILVDKKTGTIFIAGLWMYGVINADGKWLEGLNEGSKDWNHQWKTKGSQPGFDVKQTSQFLIVKSEDNGKTWSEPINLTKMCKKEEWWLWAPAPGQGITLKDGTLVFPTQGRDATGKAFSNLTYSKDGGKTWECSNPATEESTTENMAVELSDGRVMLNMRSNANTKDTSNTNGRAVSVTKDLGKSWKIHPTNHGGLIEPTCMASIIRHDFSQNGKKKSVLLFSNPDSKVLRHRMTIKISEDDGMTWSKDRKILLDEMKSRGYSCLTSIDENTIGIVYESSQADLVFQTIKLSELLK